MRISIGYIRTVASLVLVVVSATAAAGTGVAVESLGPSSLSLVPLVEHEQAILQVTGPRDYALLERFAAGEPIDVDLVTDRRLVDSQGGTDLRPGSLPILPKSLVDGRYRYELLLVSKDGGRSQDGVFFVQDGLTVSRESVRANLAGTRAEISALGHALQGAREPAAEGFGSFNDYLTIEDYAADDKTGFRLSNHGAGFAVWDVYNDLHDLRFLANPSGASRLTISGDGDVGIGDFISTQGLMLIGDPDIALVDIGYDDPDIFFHSVGSTWNLEGDSDLTFKVLSPVAHNVLTLEDNSAGTGSGVGVGIFAGDPEASLHVSSPDGDGTARLLVSEASTTATARELFRLRNNGVPQFRFEDTSSDVTWSFAQQVGGFVANRLGTGGNELFIQGNGRVVMGPGGSGVFDLAPNGDLTIAGTLTQGSSRAVKKELAPVDPEEVLSRVRGLPMSTWRYRADDTDGRHMGPMAEDFRAAFGLGVDAEHLAPGDVAGVALAAIQGFYEALYAEVEALRAELAALSGAQGR